jgi:hypothetical protein
MKKNIANSAAAMNSAVMLMPVIVRIRKMPGNGTSGAALRRSIATKPAISTAESASRPIVCVEPQPTSLASTSA